MLSGVRRRPMTTHAKIAPASAAAASASIDTVMVSEGALSIACLAASGARWQILACSQCVQQVFQRPRNSRSRDQQC